MADSFNIVVIGHGASAHYVASQCHGVEGLRIVATIARRPRWRGPAVSQPDGSRW